MHKGWAVHGFHLLPPKAVRALLALGDEKGWAEPWFAVVGAGPTSLAASAMTPDMSARGQPLC